MTADGNWNLAVSTPMGERQATLSVKTEGKAKSSRPATTTVGSVTNPIR